MGPRNPRPRRPSLRRSAREGAHGRPGRHRRTHHQSAGHLPTGVPRGRYRPWWRGFRPSIQGRRELPTGRADNRGTHARVIRRPASPIGSATRSSSATRCSCRTMARRAPIFLAAMRARSIARSAACSRCPLKRGSSCAMTTRRRAANFAWETTVAEERAKKFNQTACARRTSSPCAEPRQGLGRAAAAAAVDSGEHPRGPLSAAGARRRAAAVDPGEIQGRGKSRQLRGNCRAEAAWDPHQSFV